MDRYLNFIKKCKNIHGDRYDYSKVIYKNCDTKVCIICPEHGEFWQTPYHHVNRHQGCPKCNPKKKIITIDFINKSKKIHGDKYDYSKVNNEYKNITTKVCIICPEHGEFWQQPNVHLLGCGCPKCVNKNITTVDFINKSKQIHGDKYDYSKVEYIDSITKVCIICPEHGEFWQTPNTHLNGSGCPKCVGKNKSTEEWISESKKIHDKIYDYSKSIYNGARIKVCIICPEHGEFWQTPNTHLNGSGCPKCNISKLEKDIYNTFPFFEREKTFDWLKDKRKMRLDFYSKDLNLALECQGEQHFINRGVYRNLENNIRHDKLKYELCIKHNIKLIYYFPRFFNIYNNEFYKDKLCFHNLEDIKRYIHELQTRKLNHKNKEGLW